MAQEFATPALVTQCYTDITWLDEKPTITQEILEEVQKKTEVGWTFRTLAGFQVLTLSGTEKSVRSAECEIIPYLPRRGVRWSKDYVILREIIGDWESSFKCMLMYLMEATNTTIYLDPSLGFDDENDLLVSIHGSQSCVEHAQSEMLQALIKRFHGQDSDSFLTLPVLPSNAYSASITGDMSFGVSCPTSNVPTTIPGIANISALEGAGGQNRDYVRRLHELPHHVARKFHKVFNVPQPTVGKIIGPRGSNVNSIKATTGCHVDVNQTTKAQGYSICTIFGPNMTLVEQAEAMVLATVHGAAKSSNTNFIPA